MVVEIQEESKVCIWKGCRKASPSVIDVDNLSVQKVALGSSHYAVLLNCGKLLLFGNNQHGQLGVGDNFSTLAEPMPGHFFIDVACGKDHTTALKKDGSVYCWGSNLYLQCGCHDKQDFIPPQKVNIIPEGDGEIVKIVQIRCGHFHTLALSESGVVWSWGFGAQLGLGKIHWTHIPRKIESLKHRKVLSIDCGAFHSLAIVSSEISSSVNQLMTDKFDDAVINNIDDQTGLVQDKQTYSSMLDKKLRLTNSHSLTDVQNSYASTMHTSASVGHKFELELKSCPCPIIQTIQETPDQLHGHFLSRSPISELMLENEEETSFVDLGNLEVSKDVDVQSVCLLDDCSDVLLDLISLNEDVVSGDHSDKENADNLSLQHRLSFDIENPVSKFSSMELINNIKISLSLEEKQTKSTSSVGWNSIPNTCSSFLDEFKAKEFLQKQLECVNPLVSESLPSYGSAIQSKFESASSAVKMLTSNDPLSKKFETLLQHVPTPPGAVQEYVSQLTRTVVSNIKTSVDRIEAITEGVSGGVMGVVKMAKRKSFGEMGMKESVAADIVHLCVKNSTLNRTDSVSKSTSMNPIDVSKQTHHRNVSLPTGTLESFPDILRHESRMICWDTEVWSWGQGSKGQLGLGDTMDRDVPQLMTFFSHEHICQVNAGHSHNVALSHSGQAFVWGDNGNNQLSQQNISMSSSPLILELQGGLPCWSVAAGDKHTLIACDGLDNSAQVFYCGYDLSCSDDKLTHVKQMMSVKDLKLMGRVQEIYSGGEMSGCLLEAMGKEDEVRRAVYDLSCSERCFCLTLKRLISTFLQPLIQKLDVSECNGLMVGAAKVEGPAFNSHWSHSFRLLFSKLSCLQQLVARNQCDLKHWLRLQPSDPRTMPFVRDSERFVTAYASYFKAYCDAVSCLCFKSCVKNNKDFFDMIVDDFAKFLEEDKFSSSDPSSNLQNLARLPYYRLREYQKTLDKIAEHYPAYTSIHADLQRVLQMWRRLRQNSDNDLTTSSITASYWTNANPKLLDALQTIPSRRLVRDGKIFPLNLNSGGGPRLFSWSSFVLFNDCFVQMQYSNYLVFPLQIVWLEISPDSKTLKNAITLTMPEDILVLTAPTHSEKAEWVWCLQQTIRSSLGSKNMDSQCISPPVERQAAHTFQKSGWLKDATYTGQWRNALMHGKGELKWTSGKKYMGSFVNGQMEGHGTMTTPKEQGMEVQDGTWKAGQLHGYGVIRYSNGDVYRGYFMDGKRHGHGIMKQGKFTTTSASIYYGQWLADKKSGYGVFDDIPRGQKYMGQWSDDNRHGNGVVVTLDGYYFEGNFSNGKMSGRGLFMADDNHFYEGDFSGFAFSGKGTLTFPNGDFIDGSFGGNFSDGVKINGTLRKGSESHELKPVQNLFSHQSLPNSFGKMAYPAEGKWVELYKQCYAAIGCSKDKINDDCSEVWNKVASFMASIGPEKKSPINTSNILISDDDMNVIPAFCQQCLTYPIWMNIRSYLTKSFDHHAHPLGFLLSSLVDVYLATYVGVNAHVRLLVHATLEFKAYVENIYAVVRHLFPKLPTTSCLLPITDDMRDGDELYKTSRFKATPQALLHPIIIPKVYPPLFNLFVIHNEKNDDKYWRRASLWNKQSDQALMTYLDVDRKYYDMPDVNLCENVINSNNNKHSYQDAVECLQRISTSLSPYEKMLQIHAAFHEINLAVERSLGKCPQWSMDELFPVFWFVVVRSRIQHLGAEIHFIEELVERHLENGELGLMFTTLKACYFQILNEKHV